MILILILSCGRLKSNHQLDFTDPAAVKQLTKTLLKLNFGLKIALPDNRLCPPVSLTCSWDMFFFKKKKKTLHVLSVLEPPGTAAI